MAKIDDRKKLSRGVKLSPGHVFDTLRDVKSVVESVAVDTTQLEKPFAPFCVNLCIPSINMNSQPPGTVCIPFVLPPLQDFFDKESMGTDSFGFGIHKPTYRLALPKVMFTGISFSFDQRNEPAAIASNYWRDGTAGKDNQGCYGFSAQQGMLCYDLVSRLNIRLSLIKKDMLFFSSLGVATKQDHTSSDAIWSCLLPSFFFANTIERANPFIQTDIDLAIDPYSSYILKVECPELCDNVSPTSADQYIKNLVLPSVEASLKFKHELVAKDTGIRVNNIPENASTGVDKKGVATASTVSVTQPATGAAIQSDDLTHGVSSNLHYVDEVFKDKMAGGWTPDADLPITEQLGVPAGYDVIALPLFGNAPFGGIAASNETFNTQGYVADAPGTTGGSGAPQYQNYRAIFDRRVMPIHYAYTIHHAILAWNWTPFKPFNTSTAVPLPTGTSKLLCNVPPANTNFKLEVGIGLGSALKSDTLGYNQIAHIELTDPHNFTANDTTQVRGWGEGSSLIDRITASSVNSRRYIRDNSDEADYLGQTGWNWELHAMKLDWRDAGTVTNSPGFFGQDYPVFMGPGRTNAHNRVDSGTDQYTGSDQFVEARAAFYSTDSGTNGIMPDAPVKPNPSGSNLIANHKDGRFLFVGYGGCWVYLICKKHVTG